MSLFKLLSFKFRQYSGLPLLWSKMYLQNQIKSSRNVILSVSGTSVGVLWRYSLIKQELTRFPEQEKLIHSITLAAIGMMEHNYSMAESSLKTAHLLAENNSLTLREMTVIYSMLATVMFDQGKLQEAEIILIQGTEKLMMAGAHHNDNVIIRFGLKLSIIYAIQGEENLAEIGFKNYISVLKMKLLKEKEDVKEETATLYTTTLFWYGKFLYDQKLYTEAIIVLKESLEMCRRYPTMSTSQTMVILYYLSEVYCSLQKYDDAIKQMLYAISISEGHSNKDLPLFYAKLGEIYMYKEFYDLAREWCENGKELAVRYGHKLAEEKSSKCLRSLENYSLV